MTVNLTAEQQQALDARSDAPLQLVDPRTNTTYVLLKAEQYERIKALFEEDPFTPAEKRFLLAEAGKRAGWDSPEMDVYDEYDRHRVQP